MKKSKVITLITIFVVITALVGALSYVSNGFVSWDWIKMLRGQNTSWDFEEFVVVEIDDETFYYLGIEGGAYSAEEGDVLLVVVRLYVEGEEPNELEIEFSYISETVGEEIYEGFVNWDITFRMIFYNNIRIDLEELESEQPLIVEQGYLSVLISDFEWEGIDILSMVLVKAEA